MKKRDKIIYWISTILIILGMLPGGIGQIFHAKWSLDLFQKLGYPFYLLPVIGTWKVLGCIALLAPKFPLVKEWAYAGFFFAMSGALVSHIASGDSAGVWSPVLMLFLIAASWYFRPSERKIVLSN